MLSMAWVAERTVMLRFDTERTDGQLILALILPFCTLSLP